MKHTLEDINHRTKWFREARFGMFIHILFQEKGNGFVVIRNYLLKIMNRIFKLLTLRITILENGLGKQKPQV